MLVTVYKDGRRQMSYRVDSVEDARAETLERWRNEEGNETDPEETPFDLYLQELVMQFTPALFVTVSKGWYETHGFIWFDWGCLKVHSNGKSSLYIDNTVEGVSFNCC